MRTMELKDKYERYVESLDEDEKPMSIEEFGQHLAEKEADRDHY